MNLVVAILIILLLFGGGGYYGVSAGWSPYGYGAYGGVGVLLLAVVVILMLRGGL